jgi:protein gp37
MGKTSIEWTDFSFNAWLGCTRVSPECDNCYADRGSRRLAAQHGLKLWDEGSSRYFTGASYWDQLPAWNRKAERAGVRARVFCASYSDVGEDRPELVAPRERLCLGAEALPWLDFLFLTKRPENLVRLVPASWRHGWPPNVWAGTTVGVSASLGRLEALRAIPAAVRFVSAEPLIEPIYPNLAGVHWLIVGGESGPKARPFHLHWARQLRDRCRDERVAFFFKQAGANAYDGPNRLRLLDGHGGDLDELPPDLHAREFPAAARAAA